MGSCSSSPPPPPPQTHKELAAEFAKERREEKSEDNHAKGALQKAINEQERVVQDLADRNEGHTSDLEAKVEEIGNKKAAKQEAELEGKPKIIIGNLDDELSQLADDLLDIQEEIKDTSAKKSKQSAILSVMRKQQSSIGDGKNQAHARKAMTLAQLQNMSVADIEAEDAKMETLQADIHDANEAQKGKLGFQRSRQQQKRALADI